MRGLAAAATHPESGVLDVTANDLYGEGRWPEVFARLRRDDPVHFCPTSFYGPYWSVTRHADIAHVEALPQLFSSSWTHGGITILHNDPDIQLPMFIAMDRPEHTAMRRTVSPAFSPSALTDHAAAIRARTAALLDSLPVDEPFDWVDRVSTELTTQMLATLFDFPWEDRRLLATWANWAGDFRAAVSPALRRKRQRVLQQMVDYFGRLWAERRNSGLAPDLLSRMIHSDAMSNLRPQEFCGNLMLLVIGGTDTTRNSMTGLVVALEQFPENRALLEADHGLVVNAVSELIRWQTPLSHMRRTATEDTEIGGKLIRKDDKVVLWYNSANRDEAVFTDADRFDVTRANARRHLAFGFGIHRCVGARLAELQLYILLEEMLNREMRVTPLHAPMRIPSPFANGYRKQMVTITRS
ncbi:cytochrome P450 [uncultured Sphingosinicella sp.]|jgi:cytochrome P450|uniref:cytochrome P450 n=1 Tax=uncultured Sphingosinicella sp. TaxID=478748 RepID=UPI0030D8BA21|tara:strand:+ start:1467 stop:2702 length:1236 start_codon:yes stop_codon:yes gene_type:complete